jgi:hypothetical protein
MAHYIIVLLALLVLHKCTQLPQEELLFVFEIVRHGARAPLKEDKLFPIKPLGTLTPQGMRQRYLLGRYNLYKYGKLIKQNLFV